MKIESIHLSVFELPSNTALFALEEVEQGSHRQWKQRRHTPVTGETHVLHVRTDEGIEGICTVGDARYTTLRRDELDALRLLAVGEDPFDRERLHSKVQRAARNIFTRPGWAGAFDNCLWDIAGKAAGMPVYQLIGRARASCPAYYNFSGSTVEACVEDALSAVSRGFPAVKDHFRGRAAENIQWLAAIRDAVGPQIDALHDAAGCAYTFDEALRVGRALHELNYLWFEEPLADADLTALQRLCAALDIPILAPESLMHDITLSSQWLIAGATDWLRANARHGTTAILKLAHLAELHSARIELNGPGGLFGLVHAHLVCCIANTSYYEYFPGGTRDELGKEIGLQNPPLPVNGRITPPDAPGWGAEWDWKFFEKKRVAIL
jgi:L-alanine-DL-glutamate epimerase-like enolase superfamily enzyme